MPAYADNVGDGRARTVFSMALGSRSCPLIFRSLMAAYSSSIRRPELGMSGIPDVSFSLSDLAHYHCPSPIRHAAVPTHPFGTNMQGWAVRRSLVAACSPDVNDDGVPVIAHGVQRPRRADVACIPPEGAEHGLQHAGPLRMHTLQ